MFNIEELATVSGLATASTFIIHILKIKEKVKKKWIIHIINLLINIITSFILYLIVDSNKAFYIPALMGSLATLESVGMFSVLKNTINNETTSKFK